MTHWRGKFANSAHVIMSHLNLEGDCHMDRVRRHCLLTPHHESPHQKLFSESKNLNSSSNVANWIIVDRCSQAL